MTTDIDPDSGLAELAGLDALAAQSALIVETNNLRGGEGGGAAVVRSLKRLFDLLAGQTLPLASLAQIIVTHDGLDADECAAIGADRPYRIDFVPLPPQTGYYSAKNAGFAASGSAYVVFADSDCMPEAGWLENLLRPFIAAPDLAAVAGRTSYADSVFGAALTTIDFKYYPNPRYAGATRNFYANNVAFKREIFARFAYQPLDRTYRGHCQVFGLKLEQSGVEMRYAAGAHTTHRLPDTLGEVFKLRWMRGQDACSLTPFLVKRHFPPSLHLFARTGPIAPLTVLFCRLGFSVAALNRQDLSPLRGVRRLAAYALIVAVSLIDMAGALARGLGFKTLDRADGDNVALSYHR